MELKKQCEIQLLLHVLVTTSHESSSFYRAWNLTPMEITSCHLSAIWMSYIQLTSSLSSFPEFRFFIDIPIDIPFYWYSNILLFTSSIVIQLQNDTLIVITSLTPLYDNASSLIPCSCGLFRLPYCHRLLSSSVFSVLVYTWTQNFHI